MRLPIFVLAGIFSFFTLSAQPVMEVKGKVVGEDNKALSFASVKLLQTDLSVQTAEDGSFHLPVPPPFKEITLIVSHAGKQAVTRVLKDGSITAFQLIRLENLTLKLADVEVNGVRRSTAGSNSSIVFDRQAIEQSQPLSIANVLNYLPGQTMLKPTVSVQGSQAVTLRSATNPATISGMPAENGNMMEIQQMNEAFGVSVLVDGVTINNNANMQASNPTFMGLLSANNIDHPNILPDRSQRNGTLYSTYSAAGANTGLDLRQLQAENIESIEVISGVASASYGDYTTGLVVVNRQAGVTPWRITLRNIEATQNIGINKGFKLSPSLGTVNIGFDYLNSRDDPRDKIKGFQRLGGSLLWTFQQKKQTHFRNTLSLDINSTIDQTKLDPDQGNQRMAKFNNREIRVSNRSEWVIRKPWLYNIKLQASYSRGRQESYDQWFLNGSSIIAIAGGTETGTYEGHHAPGYYLAMHHVVGEPIAASLRLETNSIFRLAHQSTYKLTLGVNHNYDDNVGPGVLLDPDRPRFDYVNGKNDRPRPFDNLPALRNTGFYTENTFNTPVLGKPFQINLGARGDIQNGFFTLSPRINASWKLAKKIQWKLAYGVATKAPSLSQISPGNVYIDIPLINIYNADHRLFLVHTKVIEQGKLPIRPYKSYTFETGFSWDAKPFSGSVFFFNRRMENGFTNATTLVPITLPDYTYTLQAPGQPVLYQPDGTYTTYFNTYPSLTNGNYSRTNGVELIVNTEKIRALQTSFTMNTAWYSSYYNNKAEAININGQVVVDYTKEAVFGVFSNQETKASNVKSSIISNTHIPSLRMMVMLTGEIFWINRSETLPSGIYPTGYLDITGSYFPLTAQQAQSPEYAHLVKSALTEKVVYTPPMIYSNIHLRLSKEIGDALRFSFNAYNVFNIRPSNQTTSGYNYYNGQPSFGAELIFTIK